MYTLSNDTYNEANKLKLKAHPNNPKQNSTNVKLEQVSCAICSQGLDNLSIPQRQAHYEEHFQNGAQGSSSGSKQQEASPVNLLNSPIKTGKPSRIKNWTHKLRPNLENDVFWHPGQLVSPPPNYTPGFITLLKNSLWYSHAQGHTCHAALCHEKSVLVNQAVWDSGWGCGYRNFLMACIALMVQSLQPMYSSLLDSPISPGVRNLQAWIEAAWKAGFDAEGARELKKLVGTSKWIGTADLWVAFSFRGIPAELVDFDLKNRCDGFKIVADWIVDYFSPRPENKRMSNINDALRGASPIVITDKMPLILQHNGHSRTIIGYEVSNNGQVKLLTFDPSNVPKNTLRRAAISAFIASPSLLNTFSQTFDDRDLGNSSQQFKRHLDYSRTSVHTNANKRLKWMPSDSGAREDEQAVTTDSYGFQRQVSSNNKREDLTYRQLLSHFTLNPKKTSKKNYQILYFPMTAPLTHEEQMQRKIVTSKKVC